MRIGPTSAAYRYRERLHIKRKMWEDKRVIGRDLVLGRRYEFLLDLDVSRWRLGAARGIHDEQRIKKRAQRSDTRRLRCRRRCRRREDEELVVAQAEVVTCDSHLIERLSRWTRLTSLRIRTSTALTRLSDTSPTALA